MAFGAVCFSEGSGGAVTDGAEKEGSLRATCMLEGENVLFSSLPADAIEGRSQGS